MEYAKEAERLRVERTRRTAKLLDAQDRERDRWAARRRQAEADDRKAREAAARR